MGVIDIFSKRQKALRGDVPDVYTYDNIPEAFRVQLIHILREIIGTDQRYHSQLTTTGEVYQLIVTPLRKEYGVFKLPSNEFVQEGDYLGELSGFILAEADPERILDAVELSFQMIDAVIRERSVYPKGPAEANAAISELNSVCSIITDD